MDGPRAPVKLLDDAALSASSVVANSAMNRERRLAGVNSYARELGFDPLGLRTARLTRTERVAWLDLCCGKGYALTQAAERLREAGLADRVTLVGVDLVDTFATVSPPTPQLICDSVTTWRPDRAFDLVTCVHGLHYLGDKLAVLAAPLRAAGFIHDARRHRTGPGDPRLPYTYLGADDHAGANYTGQPAVHSYYAETLTP